MSFVHVQPRFVLLLDVNKPWKIRVIAIHTVEPLNDDQHATIVTSNLVKNPIQLSPIVVVKRTASGTRQLSTLHDTVVSQRVVNDQVMWTNQVANHRLVGCVATRKSDHVLDRKELGKFCFQLFMNRLLTRNNTTGRDTGSKLVDRLFGHLGDFGVPRQTEVVVACVGNQRTSIDLGRVFQFALRER